MRAWIALVSLAGTAVGESGHAEQYFREGRRLLDANQLVEACAAFADSQRVQARAGTLLNLGDCQERRGLTATARTTFLQAKALARQGGDHRREAEADRRLAALEPQLAKLTVVVAPECVVPGMSVRRNGIVVEEASWNSPVVLDPGDYSVEVAAPGYRTWTARHALGSREQAMVVVEPLAADASAPVSRAPAIASRTFAAGVLVGMNVQRESGVFGLRAVGALAAPGGELRAAGNIHYSHYKDEPETDERFATTTYTIAANLEYLWMPRPNLAVGGGLGFGADYDVVSPELPASDPRGERVNDVGYFFTVHATPVVVRLRGAVEAGLRVAAAVAGDEVTISCVAAVDWFVW